MLAALAFIAASITDWADGYVARRNNMVTSMGKFLDPLADKVLICSVLIMFCTLGWAEAWVVILIVCRELVVTGLRAIAIDEGIVLAADRYGKLKTVLQIAAIIPMLLHYPYWGVRLWPIGEIILYLALILVIRLMGKRQLGEMEPTEFVVTMLVANLAAVPLQLRLKNCIQTILELEPQIGADLSDRYFVEEFMALRRFLDSVEQMRLGEDDVERLESATATFLEELGLSRRTWQKQRRVLQ